MIIKDFDIWYSYSSYFFYDINNIESLGKYLVEKEICKVIYFSNDTLIYKENNKIKFESVNINQSKYSSNGEIHFPPNIEEYVLEGIFQASSMKSAENHMFNENFSQNNFYIRGYIEEISIKYNGTILRIYPQIKIYENGITILTFRIIAGNREIDIEEFINDRINLHTEIFEDIFVPVGMGRLIINTLLGKYRNKNKKIINKWLENITINSDNSDFKFKQCSIREILKPLEKELVLNFDFIKTIIFDNIIFNCIKNNDFGRYWIGRPTIYILKYDNQPNNSSEIINIFDKEIASILSRGILNYSKDYKKYLEKDMRTFNDYSYFASKASSLLIYGKNGLNNSNEFEDCNRGHLIYDKQIVEEAMIYYYLSYKKEEEKVNFVADYSDIIKQKREIREFEVGIQDISCFWEINDILSSFQNIFNIKEIKENIQIELKLREEETKEKNNKNSKIIGEILYLFTLLFGGGTFCNNFVIPGYDILIEKKVILYGTLYYIDSKNIKLITLYSVTVLSLCIITFILKKLIKNMK